MMQKWRVGLLAIAVGGAVSAAQALTVPTITNVGPEELVGPMGRLTTIATDSRDQPHIVCDGGAFAYLYDKIDGRWSSDYRNLGAAGHQQYYNPKIDIDDADTAFVSGIMFRPSLGLGVFVRRNVATAPATTFQTKRVGGPGFDCGNLSLDPKAPGDVVLSSSKGIWQKYRMNAVGGLDLLQAGAMYAGEGGEKNAFWVSKTRLNGQAIWHGATGGYSSAQPSKYQNSTRGGAAPIAWANYGAYRNMADDGTYVSVMSDLKDPRIAYMASDFSNGSAGPKLGICMNIFNGTSMVFSPNSILRVAPGGYTGLRRFAPQLAAAKTGGCFISYSDGGRVKFRYVSPTGEMGPVNDVGLGDKSSICTDTKGNLHIVWNSYAGIRYRKFSIAGGAQPVTVAADFDGDGLADIAVFRESTGMWHIVNSTGGQRNEQWGAPGDFPVPADYDGDGKADLAVYRASNARWYIKQSTNLLGLERDFGMSGDVPVPADYDGDGKADVAVFRPTNATWYVYGGATQQLGTETDQPVPADYDGDGKADFAVFNTETGVWTMLMSGNRTQTATTATFGISGDTPVPGDYDGDGRDDLAVFRASNATWYIARSTNGTLLSFVWGSTSDLPVPGNFLEQGKCTAAVFRPSSGEWYIRTPAGGPLLSQAPVPWGQSSDQPINADFDGDGRTEIGVFRPSNGTWYVVGKAAMPWGAPGDWPLPCDLDGDGKDDVLVFRPSSGTWYGWGSTAGLIQHQWGAPGDWPVPADYDGDGVCDLAVFRPSNGTWYVRKPDGTPTQIQWGGPGDWPVPADYDGDGVCEIAVFRPSNGTWYLRMLSGPRLGPSVVQSVVPWGSPGDWPMARDVTGDGKADIAVFRPSNGTWYCTARGNKQFGGPGDRPMPGDYDGDEVVDYAVFRPAANGQGQWWVLQSANGQLMPGSVLQFGAPSDIPIGSRR